MAGNVQATSYYSPSFIKAKNPEDLEKQMLINNVKNGKVFDYFSIIYDGKNFYAWFYKDQSKKIKVRES